jgi:hypothetical protein
MDICKSESLVLKIRAYISGQMNTSTSLDVMVKMGAFEKMPKQGSITAGELGKLIKLPTDIVGKYFS